MTGAESLLADFCQRYDVPLRIESMPDFARGTTFYVMARKDGASATAILYVEDECLISGARSYLLDRIEEAAEKAVLAWRCDLWRGWPQALAEGEV